jgi:hypothetical protein
LEQIWRIFAKNILVENLLNKPLFQKKLLINSCEELAAEDSP